MEHPISLTLFFPTYNEEDNVQQLIASTVRVVEGSPFIDDYELIIVNDGSSDATKKRAEAMADDNPNIRVITHAKNKGYGAALKTGIRAATKEYVFFTDADQQFDIVELNNLIAQLEEHQDMVVGYRAPRRDPFMRLLNAKTWNILNRVLFGLRIRDIDCAFKLFRRDIVQNLKLRSNGAMINAEILIRLQRKGVKIKEVPVSHLPRIYGSATGAKFDVILRAFREMIRLYRGELGQVTQKQALKFIVVGVFNTLLDMGIYLFLTRATGIELPYVPAKFLSFMAGTVSSFIFNRYWTFGYRSRITFAELARFYTMISISLVINLATLYATVHAGLGDIPGLLLATVFSFGASYTLSRLWVFRSRSSGFAAA